MESQSKQLNKHDLLATLKSIALMYGVPALVFFLQWLSGYNFGDWNLIILPVIGIALKLLDKFNSYTNYGK